MKTAIVTILFMGFFISCSNSEKYEQIAGEWECTSWINTAKDVDRCNNNVYFNFEVDKSYNSRLGNVEDKGKYKILNDLLYVMPRGKMEITVEILKLNQDTLQFRMNQSGEEEILTLLRVSN